MGAAGGLNSELMTTILENTYATKQMLGLLFHKRVQDYMDPSSTHTTTMGQDTFRQAVTQHYGYIDNRAIPQPCMLTNRKHDWHDLVAGHILPRAQARDAKFDLKIDDINDPRNGIFWSRAVEGAWSAGVFCFSSPGELVHKCSHQQPATIILMSNHVLPETPVLSDDCGVSLLSSYTVP